MFRRSVVEVATRGHLLLWMYLFNGVKPGSLNRWDPVPYNPPIGSTTYIPLIVLAYWVIIYHRSHLLREPETAIDLLDGNKKSGFTHQVEVGSWSTIHYRVWDTSKWWLAFGISEPSTVSYIYLHWSHTSQPSVGTYTMHGWYGYVSMVYLLMSLEVTIFVNLGIPTNDLIDRLGVTNSYTY